MTWSPPAGPAPRPVGRPAWIASAANTLADLRGWSPLVALQVEYSLLERTADRERLPVAEAFDLSVGAWTPMGAGILTGKYTRGPSLTADDSRRAAANQARLTERHLAIAPRWTRSPTSSGPARPRCLAWVRQRDRRLIPILGVRTLDQLTDLLGCLALPVEPLARLDEVSRIEPGFPYELLAGPQGRMVYGDLEPQIDLPPAAPIRRR